MLSLVLAIVVVSILVVGKVLKERSTVLLVRLGLIVATMIISFNMVNYATEIATENHINNKIDLLEDQNDDIENRLEDMVEAYVDFVKSTEGKTMDITDEMSAVLVIPKLKNDPIVRKQLETYIQNEEKIRLLEEKKLEIEKFKWLLYFEKEETVVEYTTIPEILPRDVAVFEKIAETIPEAIVNK